MKLQDNNALESRVFYLDYSKWRCGGNKDGPNKLGEGGTLLLNDEGYSCCLGLCALQLQIPESDIRGNAEPADIKKNIPVLTYTDQVENEDSYDEEHMEEIKGSIEVYENNTHLSTEAMFINDRDDTTPEYKIAKLTELFATEGYTLEVINKPE